MLVIEDNAVFVVVDIGTVLKVPALAGDGEGCLAKILAVLILFQQLQSML